MKHLKRKEKVANYIEAKGGISFKMITYSDYIIYKKNNEEL